MRTCEGVRYWLGLNHDTELKKNGLKSFKFEI